MKDKRDKFTFDIFGSQARAECLAAALTLANKQVKQRDEEIVRLKLKIAALEDNSERDAKIEKTKLSIMAFS